MSLWGGGTSYLVLTHQGPVRSCGHQIAKTQIRHSPQSTQASPPRHFRHPGCLQRFGSSFQSFERSFARAVLKEQVALLFWIASAPYGHARPQAQHFHWETQTTPASWSVSRHRSFPGNVSHSLPPSMREAVGAGNHKTAADTVWAADALWDAWGSPNPMVAATTTHRCRSPAPTGGKTCASFTIITPIEHTGVLHPVPSWKTNVPPNLLWFGGHSSTCHCHGDAFPSQCWTDFPYKLIDLWQILGGNWSNFEHYPLHFKLQPIWPLSKGADGQPIPSWGFIQRTVQFQGKVFTSSFL